MADRYEVIDNREAVKRGYMEGRKWDEYETYYVCADTMLGRVICADGGEPEDRNLYRDFKPLVDELNRLARARTIHAAREETAP